MVRCSLSILSSTTTATTPSSFLSNSNISSFDYSSPSSSSSSSRLRFPPFKPNPSSRSLRPLSLYYIPSQFRFPKLKLCSSQNSISVVEEEDGDAEQFLQSNSIADFMRFKRGTAGKSELQTAVVSYRKKFPWSLLQPFLQVI